MAITIRIGTPADNAKIQDLITKITMPGPAQMCFPRAPDFFVGAQVIGDEFVLTQSSIQLEDLIGKFLVSGGPSKSGDSQGGDAKPDAGNPGATPPATPATDTKH